MYMKIIGGGGAEMRKCHYFCGRDLLPLCENLKSCVLKETNVNYSVLDAGSSLSLVVPHFITAHKSHLCNQIGTPIECRSSLLWAPQILNPKQALKTYLKMNEHGKYFSVSA